MTLSYSTICERMRAHAVYIGEGLLFPPATEAEIQACEERLGFKLPPMMRELYLTVANGSDFFGPGYSFSTISDKFVGHGSGYPVLGEFLGNGPRPFDDATVEALRSHPGSFIVCEKHPAGFVALSHAGCNIWVTLDGFSGHLYLDEAHYEGGECVGSAFSFLAASLEEWLERDLAEPPSRSTEARYYAHYSLADVLAAESKDIQNSSEDQSEGQRVADSPSAKSSVRRPESVMDVFRKNLLTGLERSRMELTRQIHYVDAVHRAIAESDEPDYFKRDWLSDLKLTVQELAEVEAQLDNLIRTPWLK
ncbi:MAG TPA: SMI1/KNR4 family protein [Ktedonobacterales bacterium]|nr:SMI1/KNR4 family protein [Ktedonobacterales bacterium]